MKDYRNLTLPELFAAREELEKLYAAFQARNLSLDMSRGKPAPSQLDHNNALLDKMDEWKSGKMDLRNYGCLEGIAEARKLFGDLLGIDPEKIIVAGNSSLNLMYDTLVRCMLFGHNGGTPWCKLSKVKFLCPSPGYDRHFGICEDLGIEMLTVPMKEDGPDMDLVERLVAEDDSVKGIWCVPLYSNPQGICYSDETVDRLAKMKTAAGDFCIMWDNAYGVHHIYKENTLKDIFSACETYGNPNRAWYFFSTSKITYPGGGVAMMASSQENMVQAKKHMTKQTIGHDKINQLRTVRFLKDTAGVKAQMEVMAKELRPKFDMVLHILDKELAGSGLASWAKPEGGYFVALDTLDGCAKAVVALAAEAGVVMTGAGATFPYKKDPRDTNIRIAPTYPTCEELSVAMELLCVCVKLAGVRKLIADKQ
ncbi:MAG: aminotransferase class I/II-fold pyridoxal phosphate-dependent enzyme [Lentisphaeria bacterium]|nr:aminotransferase class I/II-fold pyridoxal phosphate-dependent enzyme [Lentisphaeria bacterium]